MVKSTCNYLAGFRNAFEAALIIEIRPKPKSDIEDAIVVAYDVRCLNRNKKYDYVLVRVVLLKQHNLGLWEVLGLGQGSLFITTKMYFAEYILNDRNSACHCTSLYHKTMRYSEICVIVVLYKKKKKYIYILMDCIL